MEKYIEKYNRPIIFIKNVWASWFGEGGDDVVECCAYDLKSAVKLMESQIKQKEDLNLNCQNGVVKGVVTRR